VAVDSGDVEI